MVQRKPLQKILFGSPGTGKSYKIRSIAIDQLGIELDTETTMLNDTIKTVFHPEYTYADFMGKLMPQSQGNNVMYKFYPGHFLQALGNAYHGLDNDDGKHYLLVIDELNRGNASAIFGPVFQLLDRNDNNWSSYEINLSDLELMALFKVMGYQPKLDGDTISLTQKDGASLPLEKFFDQEEKLLQDSHYGPDSYHWHSRRILIGLLRTGKISIPPNLSILATINTSDESIYYLDSAFKRRWDWEYVESPGVHSSPPDSLRNVILINHSGNDGENKEELQWSRCIRGMNYFICSNSQSIRRIEDKQIGWWFIKPENEKIMSQQIRDKLMFYLWDSVFAKDRRPLEQVISKEKNDGNDSNKLVTFADLLSHSTWLMKYFHDLAPQHESDLDNRPPF